MTSPANNQELTTPDSLAKLLELIKIYIKPAIAAENNVNKSVSFIPAEYGNSNYANLDPEEGIIAVLSQYIKPGTTAQWLVAGFSLIGLLFRSPRRDRKMLEDAFKNIPGLSSNTIARAVNDLENREI
jgi:hypothetical protein